MRALAAAGDAPGALRHAEIVHQIRQEELELPPDPEVAALAERIRRGGAAAAARGTAPQPAAAPVARSPASEPPPPAIMPPAAATARRRRAFGACPRRGLACCWSARCSSGAATASEPAEPEARRRLAVLPFENLGDSADAYFADGVTDELRGKLAAVPGLEVVASLSSNDYRGSTRRLPEIARELGVDYLLIGKIRWQRGAAGSSRVRVSPELIRLAPGAPPTTRWQQPIDAALTDVFAVQADIAAKVADALGVVLGDSARRGLTAKPTDNLAAYDEFLKGEAASQAMKADQAGLRRAIGFFERAVVARLYIRAGVEPALARAYLALLQRRARPCPRRGGAARGRAGAGAPARRIRWSTSPSATSTAASTRSTTSAR